MIMAIQFARCEYVSRSSGGNACRKASYNQREQIRCERTGELFSFQARAGNVHHEILLPQGANEKFKSSAILWNEVEAREKRINSQLAKEFVIALPDDKQVSLEDRIELTKRFGKTFVERGVAVQLDVHSPHEGEQNWHAHLLVATRRFSEDGLTLGEKARDLDPQIRKGLVVEGNLWGEIWRDLQNAYFEEKGYDIKVDPIGIVPQGHLGPVRMRHHLNEAVFRAQLLQKANEKLAQDPASVLEELTRTKAIFSKSDVEDFLNKHVPSNEKEGLLEKVLDRSIPLYDKETHKETKYFTTGDVRSEEEKLLRFVDEIEKKQASPLKARSIEKGQVGKTLTLEQKEAYDQCVSSNKNLSIIQGRAGVGKSYVLDSIRKAHEENGYRVLGLAPTHKVTLDLKESGFKEAKTCHSFLFAFKNNRETLNSKTLVMIDEAGMLGTTLCVELFHAIKSKGAKLVLVGDDRQLSSVERGGVFSALAARYGSIELKDVRRQTVGWQKAVSEALAEGHTKNAVDILEAHKAISWVPTKEEALSTLLKDWAKESLLSPLHSSLILAQRNVDVDALNQGAREILRQQGRLGEVEITCSTSRGRASFAEGDRIHLTKTDQEQALWNGSFGVIEHLNSKTKKLRIRLDKRGSKEVDPNTYDGLKHGYATTVYKGQGSTLDHVYVLHSKITNQSTNYVSLSRQTKSLSLYVSQEETPSTMHLIQQMGRQDANGMSLAFDTKKDIEKQKEAQSVSDHLKRHTEQLLTKVKDHFHKNEKFYRFEKPQNLPQEPVTLSVVQDPPKTKESSSAALKKDEKSSHSLLKAKSSEVENTRAQNQRSFIEASVVEDALKQNMAAFADNIFSSMGISLHQSSSTESQRRYGKKGHISVNLRTGAWIDFKDTERSGEPLHLLTKLKGMSFKEAVEYGASWAGLIPEKIQVASPILPKKRETLKEEASKESKAKISKAQALWDKGQEIQGTLAERYLREYRKIEGEISQDLRYVPSFYDKGSNTKHPCLMGSARNPEGQVTAVQLTFLNPETGQKATLDVAKKSFGVIKGSSVTLQKSESGPLFIAEGVETALSLKSAGINGTIQASLGLSNIKRLEPQDLQSPIIICADHDAPDSPAAKSLEKSVLALQKKGFQVSVIKPDKLGQDFNDVLKEKGAQGVREILQRKLPPSFLKESLPQENPFEKIQTKCQEMLYDYLKSENRPLTPELKDRIALQSEKASTFILHRHTLKGTEPTQAETKFYLLRAKYELDRIPEIRQDIIKDWGQEGQFNEKKDGLLAHMIAERQASIEGRLYFESKSAGKGPSSKIPELAEKELAKHQIQTKKNAEKLSQEYSLSKTAATHCAKNILRYKETHGENLSKDQVSQIIKIERMLEKRENTLVSPQSNRNEQAYLHRKEADLLFNQMSTLNHSLNSPDINCVHTQAKISLEAANVQIVRDLEKSNQLDFSL